MRTDRLHVRFLTVLLCFTGPSVLSFSNSAETESPTHVRGYRDSNSPRTRYVRRKTQEADSLPTDEPASSTTKCNDVSLDQIKLKIMFTISTVFNLEMNVEDETPRSRALDWVVKQHSPPICRSTNDWNIIQIYVLALFYYSTGGNYWENCSARTQAPCASVERQSMKRQWLSETSECEWLGISCNSDQQVTKIELARNNMTGTLPDELGALYHLEEFILQEGSIVGNIPGTLGSLEHLSTLKLQHQFLSGAIPNGLMMATSLTSLNLSNNLLFGHLSEELGNLKKMEFLHLENNMFTGPVPSTLATLTSLKVLALGGNFFSGVFPEGICALREANLAILTMDCYSPDCSVCPNKNEELSDGGTEAELLSISPTTVLSSQVQPTSSPTVGKDTLEPSSSPTKGPTMYQTDSPHGIQDTEPTPIPSDSIVESSTTLVPWSSPTSAEIKVPNTPTTAPTLSKISAPSPRLSDAPSAFPSRDPTATPHATPTAFPSSSPTSTPQNAPSSFPAGATTVVSAVPSSPPTETTAASLKTSSPHETSIPTSVPTTVPNDRPSAPPSMEPSIAPVVSDLPREVNDTSSWAPTLAPSGIPTVYNQIEEPTSPPTKLVPPTTSPSFSSSAEENSQLPTAQPTSMENDSFITLQNVGVEVSQAPSGAPSSSPTIVVSSPPSQSPTESIASAAVIGQVANMKRSIYSARLSNVSDPSLMEDASTPQGKALRWIMDQEEFLMRQENNENALEQRYIMAVFYFSTGGEEWENCSADNTVLCKSSRYSSNKNRWLSGDSECTWFGVKCNPDDFVTKIQLESLGMSGEIPNEITKLGSMTHLILEEGRIGGRIPHDINQLSKLQHLDLDYQQIGGSIPEGVFDLTLLSVLDLNNNLLSGGLPPKVGKLRKLAHFQLDNNMFNETLPEELGDLKKLGLFTITGNDFRGNMPPKVCQLRKLKTLWADCAGDTPKIDCACCTFCV